MLVRDLIKALEGVNPLGVVLIGDSPDTPSGADTEATEVSLLAGRVGIVLSGDRSLYDDGWNDGHAAGYGDGGGWA